MKSIFLNYIENLKNNHFFLLLAIITSFLNAIIQIFIFIAFMIILEKSESFGVLIKDLLKGSLIFASPFILVWIITFIATNFSQRLKLIVSIITFFINSFIILFQSVIGSFVVIFMLVF